MLMKSFERAEAVFLIGGALAFSSCSEMEKDTGSKPKPPNPVEQSVKPKKGDEKHFPPKTSNSADNPYGLRFEWNGNEKLSPKSKLYDDPKREGRTVSKKIGDVPSSLLDPLKRYEAEAYKDVPDGELVGGNVEFDKGEPLSECGITAYRDVDGPSVSFPGEPKELCLELADRLLKAGNLELLELDDKNGSMPSEPEQPPSPGV